MTTATRRGFERVYDVPERALPATVLAVPTPTEADAQRALVALASRALGIATERDLRDYFRLPLAAARASGAELCEAGTLRRVAVEAWAQPAYLATAARLPRQIEARALLSPFDSLVWDRARTERLFGFRYRLAFYTPPEERAHGYYVMPFLLGDRLVARVDLKADRTAGTLRVLGAHVEPGAARTDVAGPLRAELERVATWLGLGRLRVDGKAAQACAAGDHFASAVLTLCRASGDKQPCMEYKMADILISSVQVGGAGEGGVPTESWSLHYSKIEMAYTQIGLDGKPKGKGAAVGWDLKANKKI